jgi:hypothetical protein
MMNRRFFRALLCALLVTSSSGCGLVNYAAGLVEKHKHPAPTPAPTPAPAPAPTPDPLDSYRWNGSASPEQYPETAKLHAVRVSGGSTGPCVICWDWDDPHWRPYGPKNVMGNAWIGYFDGRVWQMGVWEMVKGSMVGSEVCRTSEAKAGQPPLVQAHGPISGWVPASGDKVRYMISTTTRGGVPAGSVVGKSNIVEGVWP